MKLMTMTSRLFLNRHIAEVLALALRNSRLVSHSHPRKMRQQTLLVWVCRCFATRPYRRKLNTQIDLSRISARSRLSHYLCRLLHQPSISKRLRAHDYSKKHKDRKTELLMGIPPVICLTENVCFGSDRLISLLPSLRPRWTKTCPAALSFTLWKLDSWMVSQTHSLHSHKSSLSNYWTLLFVLFCIFLLLFTSTTRKSYPSES